MKEIFSPYNIVWTDDFHVSHIFLFLPPIFNICIPVYTYINLSRSSFPIYRVQPCQLRCYKTAGKTSSLELHLIK